MGPFLQYATEKPADVIELRIYKGADGSFELYEDENDNYNYEKGKYATIGFNWNDKENSLTIGPRKGTFNGMLKDRTFNVVVVKPGIGTGVGIESRIDQTVRYSGQMVKVKI
jgi:alpha-D-xyloside xylohydrolase